MTDDTPPIPTRVYQKLARDRIPQIIREHGLDLQTRALHGQELKAAPAFHADWFFNRLAAGYSVWQNPFNRKKQYVSFSKTRVMVFWTKNPSRFMERLHELDERDINYYFQYTINDYEPEGLEPNVPALKKRLQTFKKLSEQLGSSRVIWRFDPLILTNKISEDVLLDRIADIARHLNGYTQKLVFSFVDILEYRKVQRNLATSGIQYQPFTSESITKIAKSIQQIALENNMIAATCGETHDLSAFGIVHNKCIDDDLMAELFADNKVLMNFLGRSSQKSLFTNADPKPGPNLKDKGQRKACGCIVSKDIGQYNICGHLCVYCYANASEKIVRKNLANCVSNSESLI